MARTQEELQLDPQDLHFIPMGGSEQFGVNFNLYAYQGKWLAIDLGIGFADHRIPGVDILMPDPAFMEARRHELEGLIVTHAHEDHVGAIPYLWPRLKCPVYCTAFTAAVLKRKIEEHPDSRKMEINVVEPGEIVDLGPFKARFIHVAHSIPQTCAVVIETPEGRVVHSGDWNLDPAPVVDAPTDEAALQDLGQDGVLAYIGDSTNCAVDGRTGSEADAEKGLEEVFATCKGRIVVTTFSSNIGRMQSICKAAEANGRSVTVIGRSMHNMIAAARECGYLGNMRPFVDERDMEDLPADQQVYIVTGSQGEARAALSKISRGDMSSVRLGKGDTVIFSARPIPGNEKEIDTVKNNLVAGGVHVVSPGETPHTIHISGHPCRDEVADMYRWVKPELVIPVHGERMQLEAQADLARKCQIGQVIVPGNGSVIKLKKGASAIIDHIETGILALESGRLIDMDHPAIRERRKLQFTGVVHLTVVLNARGDLVADPELTTIGLIDSEDEDELRLEDDLLDEVSDILGDMERGDLKDDHAVHEELRIGIRRHVNLVLRVKPKTTVHVIRV
ncbi:MAG: ribonuclease J [Rhodospirillales bacterium]|nr:ribonuclease J [Rhodospirillales bacterium]MCB9995602.1 ribonuclease J [Rhodospirillales bacterium]